MTHFLLTYLRYVLCLMFATWLYENCCYNGCVYRVFILLFIWLFLRACDFHFETHIVCEYVFCECKCQMCTATPKSMCLISISFVILIFQTRTKKNIISNKICVKYTTSPLKHSVRQLRWIRPLQWNNFSLKNDVQMNIKR